MREDGGEEECLNALKKLQRDKTPGTDGLIIECYKYVLNMISDALKSCWMCCLIYCCWT